MNSGSLILSLLISSLLSLSASAASHTWITDRIDGNEQAIPALMEKPATAGELKVLWWNIREGGAWGRELQARANSPHAESPLEVNLKTIAAGVNRPDVIVLGEYVNDTLTRETEAALLRAYPYQHYVAYNPLRNMGLQAFSRYPIEAKSEKLDWTPYPASTEEQARFKKEWKERLNPEADKYYDRPFVDLKIKKGAKTWHVIPAHLLNNWVPLATQIGTRQAGLMLVFGNENPHFYQVKRLMNEKITPLLAQSRLDHSSVVVLGDFNLPDSIYGMIPRAFWICISTLYPIHQNDFTFPATSADNASFHRMTIDHGFYNGNTREVQAARPALTGSDHYPLEVLFQAL